MNIRITKVEALEREFITVAFVSERDEPNGIELCLPYIHDRASAAHLVMELEKGIDALDAYIQSGLPTRNEMIQKDLTDRGVHPAFAPIIKGICPAIGPVPTPL